MKYEVLVENIKCGGCANSIEKLVHQVKSVEIVSVDIENGKVEFESENDVLEKVKEKLAKAGYPEIGKGNLLHSATSYVSCMIGKLDK